MCLEDVRIGEASQGKQITFTATGASDPVLPQDNHRRAIILGAPDLGFVTYSQGASAVLGLGYNMAAGQQPIVFDRDLVGSIVSDPWFAIADVAGRKFAVGFTHFIKEDMQ